MRQQETGLRLAADDPRAVARLRVAVRELYGLKWWPAFETAARARGWLRSGVALPAEAEIARGVEAAIPKETALFRHAAHWPVIGATGAKCVWSAGCATGEEAFSIAIVLPTARVLATDVAGAALQVARGGVVRRTQLDKLAPAERKLFGADGRVPANVLSRIDFQLHNLARGGYPKPFDLIVCRNVLVYMEPEYKVRVVAWFAEALVPGGLLLLSSADRGASMPAGFEREDRGGVVFFRRS